MADILKVSVDSLVGHDSVLLDVNTLSDNQKTIINKVINLTDNDSAKLIGYIDSLTAK